jgi:NADH dehydrogenase (ubiquinone) 1 beta subcomplex subunit 9
MATGGPKAILTHAQRVCRLYKKALRTQFDWSQGRHNYRYECVLIRAKVDETRNEKDMRKLAAMVEEGEEEVFQNQHPAPFIYKDDEGGITFARQAHHSDQILDQWHPWERANYIDYFAKREKLKNEYHAYYDKSIAKKFEGNAPEYPNLSPAVVKLQK